MLDENLWKVIKFFSTVRAKGVHCVIFIELNGNFHADEHAFYDIFI